jgi:hypothetical protein
LLGQALLVPAAMFVAQIARLMYDNRCANGVGERFPNLTQACECQFLLSNPLARAHLVCVALDQVLAQKNDASNIENPSRTPFFRVDGSRERMIVFSSTTADQRVSPKIPCP